jgi:hypothetical protein
VEEKAASLIECQLRLFLSCRSGKRGGGKRSKDLLALLLFIVLLPDRVLGSVACINHADCPGDQVCGTVAAAEVRHIEVQVPQDEVRAKESEYK